MIFVALLLLYFVGNGTAKAIFERRASELSLKAGGHFLPFPFARII